MNRRLILFTNTWPFDFGETFLDIEAQYLSNAFEHIEVFPLYATSNNQRAVPSNFNVHNAALSYNPKSKAHLFKDGIFSTAPLLFSFKEFFADRCFTKVKFWNFFTALLTFRASYNTIKCFNPSSNDIIYSYWGDKWSASLPFLKKEFGCRCIARFHNSDLYEEVKGYIPFRKMLFDSLDVAFPISENGAVYIKERYHYNKNIMVSRLGVQKAEVNPSKAEDFVKIVSCSNAVPVKRLDIIAKALSLIKFPIEWTHIGDGPTLENTKALCNGKNVRFLGRLSNSEVKELYAKEHFDLFINVSSAEGVPVSIMEVFAQGIPVMATNVGGTAEIVDSTVGALLPFDITPELLAQEIKRFTTSDTQKARANAIERWNNMCNADTNYKAFTNTLTQI